MPIEKAKSQKLKAKKSGIKVYKFFSGFTFIELLIVISLMAIVGASVSAAYLSFENRQRVKEAALIVKNQIRAVQNNALSGVTTCSQIPDPLNGNRPKTFTGWEVWFDLNTSNQFYYSVICKSFSAFDVVNSAKVVTLPASVTIQDVKYGGTQQSPLIVYFRALNEGATFHNNARTFSNTTGELINILGTIPQNDVTIVLSGSGILYNVVIRPSGEVYEVAM